MQDDSTRGLHGYPDGPRTDSPRTSDLLDAPVPILQRGTPPPEVAEGGANASLRHEAEVELVSAPIRVGALLLAAGAFVAVVLILLKTVRKLITDGDLADPVWSYWGLLVLLVPFLLFHGYRYWRTGWRGVVPEKEEQVNETVESRAMLDALERHDRLLSEARTVPGPEAGGESRPTSRSDEIGDERCYEPTNRGFEAKIAARMKERETPGELRTTKHG